MSQGLVILIEQLARRLSAASLGPVAEFALRFARTVALSHLLVPADLGACIALGGILSGCKLATDLGLEKYVIVFGREAPARAIAAARQIAVFRGFVLAIVLLLFAPTIARFFGEAVSVETVRWLAVPLVVDGFRNWRVIQLQLDYRFGPQAASVAVAQLGALIAAVAAAFRLQDERVMLISLIAESAVYVIASHIVARSPRSEPVEPRMRSLALRYGAPLMVNGVALWALNQLDRVIVVNVFGSATLALYSLVTTLAVLPISVFSAVAGNLALPYLEQRRRDQQSPTHSGPVNVMLGHFIAAAVYAIGIAVLLRRFVPLLYGSQYNASSIFAILLSVFVFFRIIRNGINLVLLANDGTLKLTLGNFIGGAGPFVGFAIAMLWPRVESVTLGLVIGELISAIALLLLARRVLPTLEMFASAGLFASPVALVAIGLGAMQGKAGLLASAGVLLLGAAAVLASSAVSRRWRSSRL
jgi:O-antigen/teichoic acid export membrane protein